MVTEDSNEEAACDSDEWAAGLRFEQTGAGGLDKRRPEAWINGWPEVRMNERPEIRTNGAGDLDKRRRRFG